MEGYWLTHYRVGKTQGDGMVLMQEGELQGGDLDHMWSGTYEEEGPRVHADIRIVPVMSSPEEEIMAREQPTIVHLSGYCIEEFARLEGSPEDRKDQWFEIVMRKCKEPKSSSLPAKQ
jgi:hypothetical protein